MKAASLTIIACHAATGLLAAAEPEVRYFAAGLSTEATLEPAGDKLQLSVVRYNSEQDSEQILYGELTDSGGGDYRLEYKWTDDDEKEHTRTGKVRISGGSLSYSGIKDSTVSGKSVPESGGPYQEISAAVRLRNARARYEAAYHGARACFDSTYFKR